MTKKSIWKFVRPSPRPATPPGDDELIAVRKSIYMALFMENLTLGGKVAEDLYVSGEIDEVL